MTERFSLAGQRALVTGANTGIGQAIAVDLARMGAELVLVGRSSMADTAAQIAKLGGSVSEVSADLGTVEAAQAAFDAAQEQAGPVDILVNNAGIIRRADSVDVTERDWDDVLALNLKTVFFLSQAFAQARFAAGQGGRIINIASLLSFQGGIRVPSYTASKAGLSGLTQTLSNEWSAKGITVNAVAPGYVVTNNTADLRADPERSQAILDRIPIGRWGQPEDIAGAVSYLASPAAAYVTGITLPVDGGWLAR